MNGVSLVLGAPDWIPLAVGLGAFLALAAAWSYRALLVGGSRRLGLGIACLSLRLLGIAGLAFCLVDPLLTGSRPQPGANLFLVLVDRSQSLGIRDQGASAPRQASFQEVLKNDATWRTRLGQDFDLREFVFDAGLKSVDSWEALTFDGTASHLHGALESLKRRFEGRPVAGILVLTDGNATDRSRGELAGLPPIYPVAPKSAQPPIDLSVARLTASQTNFQAAPVSLATDIEAHGCLGKIATVRVLDEGGKECARQEVKIEADRALLPLRFSLKPERPGLVFYQVVCRLEEEASRATEGPTIEGTLVNNQRWIEIDRGRGPYRVLYVGGRPNWEFKYLRRSVDEDNEVQLVGLVRVARRQPKFDFRDQAKQQSNNLFKGFEHPDDETAERRDQPVLIRLGTRDAGELKGGFPVKAADLFEYHALILDDLESSFFTIDQQSLIRQFVSRRGGGLLMLGGPDSFLSGKYAKTPVGELLPVYLDGASDRTIGAPGDSAEYKLRLTREGWLQPWVRTRPTEASEKERLDKMVSFHTVNGAGAAKPGASVLATVEDASQRVLPALVAQPFGKGRSAALLIGDLWRWGLRREDPASDDFDRAWRQTIRWLVADVPQRLELRAKAAQDGTAMAMDLGIWVRDPEYQPLDDARVSVTIQRPKEPPVTLSALADSSDAGKFQVRFDTKEPGIHRARAEAFGLDGAPLGVQETGWCYQPQAEEFARLEPNTELLQSLAASTGGEMVAPDRLDDFVANLSRKSAPVSEVWISPLWHRAGFFLAALACLVGEWALRRRNGLA